MSLITINVTDAMKDPYLHGCLWQCSNTLASWQAVGTNASERVQEANLHAAQTHAFWMQVQHYVLWGLAILALIFREKAQKLISGAWFGAGRVAMLPIGGTRTRKK
jgi:hypothetical protein